MTKISFLNGFWLKMIMVVLMLLDHLYYDLFPDTLYWAHVAARVVMPVFAFLVAEGLYYTRNRSVYLSRMFLFGGIMLLGNLLIQYFTGQLLSNSILLSLGVAAALVCCIDNVIQQKLPVLFAVLSVGLVLVSTLLEGSILTPLCVVIFYYLRGRFATMCTVYVLVVGIIAFVLLGQRWHEQLLMVLAPVPIALYNGERGYGGVVSKYFFYVFYPVHIWIIFFISLYLVVRQA